ncbi:hypothetical protein AEGHOMDF_5122 [Methylobacterium soli]|nr:hypothetical protein AEGHOMDF_5122 [Methylobacterium soli]
MGAAPARRPADPILPIESDPDGASGRIAAPTDTRDFVRRQRREAPGGDALRHWAEPKGGAVHQEKGRMPSGRAIAADPRVRASTQKAGAIEGCPTG